MNPARVVELLACYMDDDDANVWNAVAEVLVAFDKLLLDEPAIHSKFTEFAARLVGPIASQVPRACEISCTRAAEGRVGRENDEMQERKKRERGNAERGKKESGGYAKDRE